MLLEPSVGIAWVEAPSSICHVFDISLLVRLDGTIPTRESLHFTLDNSDVNNNNTFSEMIIFFFDWLI